MKRLESNFQPVSLTQSYYFMNTTSPLDGSHPGSYPTYLPTFAVTIQALSTFDPGPGEEMDYGTRYNT